MHHLKEPVKTATRRHSLSLSSPCVDFPSLSYTKSSQWCSAYGLITFSSSSRNATSEIYESGSVVGIATAYGLDGPGIESPWWQDFPHLSRPALRPTQPLVLPYPRVFPGVKVRPGRDADPSPLLVPRSKIE